MTLLVTGASGFFGWHVARTLRERRREVVGTSRDGSGLPDGVTARALELDDGGAQAAALVAELRPSAVLHLAALARPAVCARDPQLAIRVNADATGALARAAREVGAAFLYTSTDLVFDGTAAPYAEDAPTSPLGPYMQSKAAGEQAVLTVDPSFLVARVSLLYGLSGGRGGGFTGTLLERLRAGQSVDLFSDERRTPIEVEDAAALLVDLLDLGAEGVVHLAGPDRVSRLEHGVALALALGVDPALCRPIRQRDLPDPTGRPADVSLQIDRLVSLVGRAPLRVAAGCARVALRAP